eukprot:jgi/Mesvir1/16528/Mv10074-RA.2
MRTGSCRQQRKCSAVYFPLTRWMRDAFAPSRSHASTVWRVTATSRPHAAYDPTTEAKPCDFCAWRDLTAEDEFGRYETELVVTASNLFKYCGTHGLVLFKHHDPLHFNARHVAEALLASAEWFRRGHTARPEHFYPLLVWNCLPRAGASQFHGHLQVLLSGEPFPAMDNFLDAAARYDACFAGDGYLVDLLRSYDSIGLLRGVRVPTGASIMAGGSSLPLWEILCGDALPAGPSSSSSNGTPGQVGTPFAYGDTEAFCFASITPVKDMEVLVMGSSLESPAVHVLLHAVLRALIDDLGVQTFNVACGIGIRLTRGAGEVPFGAESSLPAQGVKNQASTVNPAAGAADVPRGNATTTGGKSTTGSVSYGSGGASAISNASRRGIVSGLGGYGMGPWGPSGPVILRVASRGSMSVQSSDIGALELFAGSAIGHTDPYTVIRAIDQQLRK